MGWIPDSKDWIPDSKDWIPDSKAQDSGFHRQKNVGFRIPDSLTRGEISTIPDLSIENFTDNLIM